jgi:hypothetical protein
MAQTDRTDPKEPSPTLSDADISSERVLRRRSFLSQTGLLVGGALAVAAGVRAARAGEDDRPRDADDPDYHKPGDPDKRKHKHRLEPTDPGRATDPDGRRVTDPEGRRPTDPEVRRPPEPDRHKAPDATR